MASPEYAVSIHGEQQLATGYSVRVETPEVEETVDPHTTAGHEAFHAAVMALDNKRIDEASIVPNGPVLGYVKGEFSDAAFAASAEFDCDGTGHDVGVLRQLGFSVAAAGRRARGLVSGNMHMVAGIAGALSKYKTLSHEGVVWAMNEADRKKQGTFEADETSVIVSSPRGNERRMGGIKTLRGVAMIPGQWVELPKAA